MGISISEAAELAHQCYKISNNDAAAKLPEGWNTVNVNLPNGGWDTLFAVFVEKEKRQVVLAVRGTQSFFNFLNDIALLASSLTGRAQEPAGQHHVNAAAINICNQHQHPENPAESERTPGRSSYLATFANVAALGFGLMGFLTLNPLIGKFGRLLHKVGGFMESIEISEINRRYEITIVGHSLGAAMAQLAAIHAGVGCIVFENPGVKAIVDQVPEYKTKWENNRGLKMISCQSAPNTVNTLDEQLGEVYRLKLPHVRHDSLFQLLSHRYNCFVSSLLRLVILGTVFEMLLGIFVPNTTLFASMFAVIEWWFIFVGWKLTATMCGFQAVLLICSYFFWFKEQHTMLNISPYLSLPERRIVKMVKWPIRPVLKSNLKRWVRYVIPFQKDTYGIHNLLHPNGMGEARVEGLNQYVESKQKRKRRTTSSHSM